MIVRILLFVFLFLLPLINNYFGFGYEQAKVLFFLVFLTLLWIILFIKLHFQRQKLIISNNSLNYYLLLFLLILAITSLSGVSPLQSILGAYPYYQGLIVYMYLGLLYLLISVISVKKSQIFIALTLSSLVISLWALIDFILLKLGDSNISTYAGRVVGSFGQPNFLAGYLLLTLPFTLSLVRTSTARTKFALGIIIGLMLTAMLVSQSRVAIGLLVGMVLVLLLNRLKTKLRLFVGIFTIVSLLGSISFSVHSSIGPVWEELDRPPRIDWFLHQFPERGFYFWQFDWSKTPEKRLYLWPVVGDLIRERPFLGYGLENLSEVYINSSLTNYHGLNNLYMDRSHNILLDLFVFSGVGGVVCYLLLLWQMWKKAYLMEFKIWIFLYLSWSFFQNQSIAHLVLFWLTASLISKNTLDNERSEMF